MDEQAEAFLACCLHGIDYFIKMSIENGFDPKPYAKEALINAIQSKRPNTLRLLLEHVDVVDGLISVAINSCVNMIDVILDHGGEFSEDDINGIPFLFYINHGISKTLISMHLRFIEKIINQSNFNTLISNHPHVLNTCFYNYLSSLPESIDDYDKWIIFDDYIPQISEDTLVNVCGRVRKPEIAYKLLQYIDQHQYPTILNNRCMNANIDDKAIQYLLEMGIRFNSEVFCRLMNCFNLSKIKYYIHYVDKDNNFYERSLVELVSWRDDFNEIKEFLSSNIY